MPQRKNPFGRDSQQRELLPIHTAFPFNSPPRGNHCTAKVRFYRQEASDSAEYFRRTRPTVQRRGAFRPRCALFRRTARDFGTRFVLISVNCGTATAVRFLHLFKFGLVVLGGQPPGAAGNREIPCCFCVRMRGGRGRPRRFRVRRVRKSRPVFRSVLCGAPAADFTGRQCAPARKLCGGR